MIVLRRDMLKSGGGILAALLFTPAIARAGPVAEIVMQGRPDGSHVWYEPWGLRVKPGTTIRWTNADQGNSHTATAYHPALGGRPLRMPEGAEPWDSDYLLPGESFTVRLDIEGVYDYFCVPHEHAGMVGRIVVGTPEAGAARAYPAGSGETALPAAALEGFPAVADILASGHVSRGKL